MEIGRMKPFDDCVDFREAGREAVEWIAGYLRGDGNYPVLSQVRPGEVAKSLPEEAPASPQSFHELMNNFEKIIIPGITHWNNPSFFAYFSSTGSSPGVLGDMLVAALNVNGMLWKTSPAATELEEVVVKWLRQMLGLPDSFFGVLTGGASMSSLCAMAAARENLNLGIREHGLAGRKDLPKLRIYASEEAHSSIEKGVIVLGLGHNGLRKIPTDEAFRMRADLLAKALDDDIKNGYRPLCVVATLGTTSTTSVDPIPEIADLCARHKVWLHVDGAHAGAAGILPEKRSLFAGLERADSFVVNPHKWLFTPVDCSALYTTKPDTLRRAFSLVPEYLKTEEDAVHNLMDYGLELGRRFRALKLWFVLNMVGQTNLQNILRRHMALAQDFAGWIKESADFELMAPVPFSTVCFRFQPRNVEGQDVDKLNEKLLESVNQTGEVFLSHTKLRGKFALRVSIGHLRTEKEHIDRAWKLLREHAARRKENSLSD